MTTLELQPDGTAGEDTYLKSTPPAGFPTASSLEMGDSGGGTGKGRVLMRFDLSAIPPDAAVESAQLELNINVIAGSSAPFMAYRTAKAWVEANADWTNYASGTAWATAGGDFDTAVADGPLLAPTKSGASAFDLRNIAQDAVSNRDGVMAFGLVYIAEDGGTSDPRWQFRSSDYFLAAQRPKLTLEYYAGGKVWLESVRPQSTFPDETFSPLVWTREAES